MTQLCKVHTTTPLASFIPGGQLWCPVCFDEFAYDKQIHAPKGEMVNTMENQNENQNQTNKEYGGVQASLEQIEQEMEAARKTAQADSRYRTIDDGKTARLSFTGNIYKRDAQWEGQAVSKLGFETTEKTPKGESRVFETGNKSSTARELVKRIKEAKATGKLPLELLIKRTGTKASTRYEISELE